MKNFVLTSLLASLSIPALAQNFTLKNADLGGQLSSESNVKK